MTTNFHTAIPYQSEATSAVFNGRLSALDDALSGVVPITGMDINGGSIDNTPIGATTANTGRFTDLTVTGSTTGVNIGSSNVTSGTFDNARINWASPSAIGSTTANTLRGTTLALTSTNNVLSNLIPSAAATYDLGSLSNRWRSVIASNSNFSQVSTATSGTFFTTVVDGTFSPATNYTQVPVNLRNTMTISATGNQLTSEPVYGLNTHITKSGSGSLVAMRNTQARTTYSNGTIGTLRGLGVLNEVSGGTITTLEGVRVDQTITGSPTIATSTGVAISNMGGSGITSSYGLVIATQSGSSSANIALVTNGGDVIINETGTTSTFRVESDTNTNMLYVDGTNNRVGIGTNSPTRTLEVTGTIGSLTTYNTTVGGTNRALYVDSAGLIGYVVSREGAKNSIVALRDELGLFEKLIALNPISFYYNGDMSGQRRYGLSANHVDTINSHWVSYDEGYTTDEETGEQTPTGELIPATVNYTELIAPIIDAIQRIHTRLSALEGA